MTYVFGDPAIPAVPVRGTSQLFAVRRIFCIGFNYADHNREMGRQPDHKPVFFTKPADAVVSADAARAAPKLPYPLATSNLHYEAELVVALKHGGTNLSPVETEALVFGHAVGIDLTRRDLQNDAREHGAPWDMAKGFDRSAPLGDIVPVETLRPHADAAIRLVLNGETKQDARLSDMIVKVPEMLSILSGFVELKPGDLVFTGTPQGVGPLQRGDHVEAGIEGLGVATIDIA